MQLNASGQAGCGLAGIVSAMLGTTTCITDKEYVLPLILSNARLNANEQVERGQLWASRLEWGQRLAKWMLRCEWNYVLASGRLLVSCVVAATINGKTLCRV